MTQLRDITPLCQKKAKKTNISSKRKSAGTNYTKIGKSATEDDVYYGSKSDDHFSILPYFIYNKAYI